jgi:serine O-acetyltransferase
LHSRAGTGHLGERTLPISALVMKWLNLFRQDLQRFRPRNRLDALKMILTEQGLWAVLEYRVSAAVYQSRLPRLLKFVMRLPLILWHKLIELVTGVNLPCSARIGPGLFVPHCGMRVLHGGTEIGENCTITQGVTIGISGRGERRGVPRIGDRVYIGPNAVIVGKITVGNDVLVGANSLVNRDVPEHCTVVGVPAVVASHHGSEGYLE